MRHLNPLLLSLLVLLAGCDAISPFIGDDLKNAICDRDGDGLLRASTYCGGDDCNDGDEGVGVLTWYVDEDMDGYGTQSAGGIVQCALLSGYASRAGDCDDNVPQINPDIPEVCDSIDNDCDELLDELDDGLIDGFTRYEDRDSDLWGSEVQRTQCEEADGWVEPPGDCNDADALTNPNATEICTDLVDNDCDGVIDTDAVDVPWYRDADEDGYGDTADSQLACSPPDGYIEDATDCNDSDTLVNPGVEEICNNGLDDNCDESPGACDLSGIVSLADADSTYNGEAGDNNAGYSVTNAGDVNGDGIDDLAVGAPGEDTGGNRSGSAYVIFGPITDGEWNLSSADLKLTGEAPADEAGHSLAGVGDVNGDGVDDLAVGAPGEDSSGSEAGAVYVLYGPLSTGTMSLATASLKLTGEMELDAAGTKVANAGDFNDDGVDDLVVGAMMGANSSTGAVYVLYGPLSTGTVSLATASLKLTGEMELDAAGNSLAGVGDVNGDGVDDLAVGATGNDDGSSGAGAAYVLYGPLSSGTQSLSTADLKLTGEAAGDGAGSSLSTADLNDDGIDDLVVGAFYEDTAGSGAGAAYVLYGPLSTGTVSLATASLKLTGEAAGDSAGTSLAGVGDVNGDGVDDLAVGAPGEDSSGSAAGAVYVLYGPLSTGTVSLASTDLKLTGEAADGLSGYALTALDNNNDGFTDVAVGAYQNSGGGEHSGATYLLNGLGY